MARWCRHPRIDGRCRSSDDGVHPAPAPSAFPASAGSAAAGFASIDGRRLAVLAAHRPVSPVAADCCAGAAACGAWRRMLAAAFGSGACGSGSRHAASASRRPRRAPAHCCHRRRQRPDRAIGDVHILVEIVAHPVGRHEADDPPVAGVDHQPAVVAAAVDHRNRVEQAALLRNSERRKPALAQRWCRPPAAAAASARSPARGAFRRHRRIGPADVRDRLVRRTAQSRTASNTCALRGRGRQNQTGRHRPIL